MFHADIRNAHARIAMQARKTGARVISVVGTHPGAGATTLCVELARDPDGDPGVVMVVDTDVRCPRIHERFGVERAPGAAQVASGECTLDRALRRVSERLLVLTGGTWASESAGYSVETWSDLMREVRSRADLVLLDVGESGRPSATAALSAADAAVIVAEAGRSRWEQVEAVVNRVEQLKVHVLGVVLNQRRYPIPGFIYDRL
jgi:MinD-like ATPase involved in chromosome partitioning or flagellar assembly